MSLRINPTNGKLEERIVNFTELLDVPSTYSGQALKAIRVNSAETALEFFTGSGLIDWGEIGGTLSNQTDLQNALDAKFTLPSLTSGSILFSNGATITQDNANLFWDDTNKRLGKGTNSPRSGFHIVDNTTGALRGFLIQHSSNTTFAPQVAYRKSRGSQTTPTAVLTDDVLGTLLYHGHDGTDWTAERGAIRGFAAENWTASANGTYIAFFTTTIGTDVVSTERMRIDDSGQVGIGVTPTQKFDVAGIINTSTDYYIGGSFFADQDTTLNNIRLGSSAGSGITTGTNNVFLGISTGTSIITGTNNVFLGYGASTDGDYSGSIAIGSLASVTASNQMVIGARSPGHITDIYINGVTNTATNSFVLHGSGGKGTDNAGANVTIAGGKNTGNSTAGGDIIFQTSTATVSGTTLQTLATRVTIKTDTGNVGIGVTPTAKLHLPASTEAAGSAPLKITTGTLMATPEASAFEWDGSLFYATDSVPTRNQFAYTTSSITGTAANVTGIVALANGGTSAALTASNGGIFYSTASAGAILAGTATARQMLQSGASTTPAWSTTTWPATTTTNRILYSSSTSVIGEITTANSGVLVTSGAGVPSIATDIPTAVTIGAAYIYRVGGTDVALLDGGTNASLTAVNGAVVYSTASALALTGVSTAGQFLQGQGAAAPTWVAGWTVLSKAADQAIINSNTLTNDDTMTFSMVASTKYRIRGVIFWDTTAAGDFKYGFAQPASITLIRAYLVTGAAGSTPAETAIATTITTSASLTGTGTTGGYTFFDFIVHNGVNTAAFTFQFAQNTATSDTGAIVRAGSYLEYAVA